MKLPADLRPLAKTAKARGWVVSRNRRSCHIRFVSPKGKTIFTSSTPSDRRSIKNFRAQLRREGLDV